MNRVAGMLSPMPRNSSELRPRVVTTQATSLIDYFKDGSWPLVRCPSCRAGVLAPGTDSISHQSASSRASEAKSQGDPTTIEGVFVAQLECGNAACRERVNAAGKMCVDVDFDRRGDWGYATFLKVTYFEPALPLFDVPEHCPTDIRDAVLAAGRVFFADASASASRLRIGVERLLDSMSVRKTDEKRKRLSTHARIEQLKSVNRPLAEELLAVKWIGNEGAHLDKLSHHDVLDGAELFAHALHQLYDRTDRDLQRLARRINERRGSSS